MPRVAITAPYVVLPGETGSSRFTYLADLLVDAGMEVELITSSFHHMTKKHRQSDIPCSHKRGYRITLIHEPGYPRNICIKRLVSHYVFALNLRRYLNKPCSDYDLVYCAVPTPEAAIVAAAFARSRSIPFIIDVQDIWPEAMKLVLRNPLMSSILLAPLRALSDRVYSSADAIVAVSQTYLNRAMVHATRSRMSIVVPLGTDLSEFDQQAKIYSDRVTKPSGELWVTYIGSLGTSYDLPTLIRAVSIVQTRVNTRLCLMVLGDGPRKSAFEKMAVEEGIHAVFTGMLPHGLMAAYLCKSDIAVNPLMRDSAGSITNKVCDYMSAGLPIINSSSNDELRTLIQDNAIGYNCKPEDPEDMARVLQLLCSDRDERVLMGSRARMLAEEILDRRKTYMRIVDLVKQALTSSERLSWR